MNPQFRNPPPGGLDPNSYDDPVTLPAADIAENPYWKRDVRRRYPQLSTITQADAVALLQVGSVAVPKQELIGDAGSKQLVAAQEEGTKGLSVAFEKNTGLAKDVLGPGGMPQCQAVSPTAQRDIRDMTWRANNHIQLSKSSNIRTFAER